MKLLIASKYSLLAVLLLSVILGCGGSNGNTAADLQVNMVSNAFQPQIVSAKPGQNVVFTNLDSSVHTVTGDVAGGPDSDSTYPVGIPHLLSYTFNVPSSAAHGTVIYYHSRINNEGMAGNGTQLGTGMVGEIQVQ